MALGVVPEQEEQHVPHVSPLGQVSSRPADMAASALLGTAAYAALVAQSSSVAGEKDPRQRRHPVE